MGTIKQTSLIKTFRKFLICLLGGLCLSAIIPFLLFLFASNMGLVTLADQNERQTEALIPILTAAPDVSEITFPIGTKYLRLNKDYESIDTNMSDAEMERALIYAKTGLMDAGGQKQFVFVARADEYIVLQYFIGSQYLNTWLNDFLPSPETLLILLIIISSLSVCVYLTVHFSRQLNKELTPILEATKEVENQNLDFKIGHSKISEFENVVLSFDNMRNSLKGSLEQQWRNEKAQREQIASLAHDLKTPLTVVQGNLDLLEETNLDDEQQEYVAYAVNGSEQMKQYIKVLIDISRADTGYQLKKEPLAFHLFWAHITRQAEWICKEKNLKLESTKNIPPIKISADSMLLERAIMNLIANASEYSPENAEIIMEAHIRENSLTIAITDYGRGFSEEELKHACEKFYMGDPSRNSKLHYGMGLYIADRIIKQHHGTLTPGNSPKTNGAEMIIKLPL